MVSCQYYMLVASRKNLLVHKDQQLEFIMSCKLSANFSQCIPPKGIFKTVWTKLFFSPLCLYWHSHRCCYYVNHYYFFFFLKYFPGFPFTVTILLLLGDGTISFMGHKCFLLSIQSVSSFYCVFPVYYKMPKSYSNIALFKPSTLVIFLIFSVLL